ncbi:MAG TPA: hypothetical protein VMI52_09750 [Acetobacteraceae bacterium]|nr:hypothetical protein [Acetobacteraceae bacterium]
MSGTLPIGVTGGDLAGLPLSGGAAHPGPGLPMAPMPGWIAAARPA